MKVKVRNKKRLIQKKSVSKRRYINIFGFLLALILTLLVVVLVIGSLSNNPRSTSGDGLEQFSEIPKPVLIIVLDDAGHNVSQLKKFLTLPFPLAIAVLPQLSYSVESAKLIHGAGKTVMVHMPMEPLGSADPGPGAIFLGDSPSVIREKLQIAVKQIPFAAGLNNHMGSKVTSDLDSVNAILEEVRSLGLFFLDSVTSSRSVARKAAGDLNIKILERAVFLDNEKNREYILEAFEEGKEIARTKGHAVMIGHVWTEELADVLLEIYPRLIDDGFDIQEISAFLEGRDLMHTGEEMFVEEEFGL